MPLHLLLFALSLGNPSQDSLPSLHSLHGEDIDTVIASRKAMTLTVKLKTGVTYVYAKEDWSKEDDGKLDPKLDEGTGLLTKTFTKVQNPPTFPGGEEAFKNYIRDVCDRNRKLVRKEGPAVIMVQFIVDQNGEVSYVQPIGRNDYPRLTELAEKALKEGPAWVPATQNGYKVVCYQRQQIIFE